MTTGKPVTPAGAIPPTRTNYPPTALWIGALELAQQPIAALDGGIQRRLRRLFAAEGLLQFVLDHIADQHERAEPNPLRIFGRRLQRDLLDRDRGAGIALVKALRAGQIESGAGHRQIAGVLVPGRLNFRLRQKGEELRDALVFGRAAGRAAPTGWRRRWWSFAARLRHRANTAACRSRPRISNWP